MLETDKLKQNNLNVKYTVPLDFQQTSEEYPYPTGESACGRT